MGFFDRLFQGLKKTRENMEQAGGDLFSPERKVDDDFYDSLEEMLIVTDMGFKTSEDILEELRKTLKKNRVKKADEAKEYLQKILVGKLAGENELNISTTPSVILVVGVNGVGKTTTIGKLAYDLKRQGKTVLLGAADTFRAAAIEQLEIWSNRADVPIIKQSEGADPAAVVFDTLAAGKARNIDVVLCDTAGRLHNKKNLMEELRKIGRIVEREVPDGDREVLLVLDATTGQNALSQARQFMEVTEITGIVLTKLDGTAKGGVVIAIKNELQIPIKYIGVGEGIEDLQPFDPVEFVDALFNFRDDDFSLSKEEEAILTDEEEEREEYGEDA